MTATGLSTRVRRLLVAAARRVGISVLSVPAGPLGGYPVQTLRPGASVSAAFVSGDLAMSAVGTVTYRDGADVWAFGHPLDAVGPRSLFLQDAYVFGVVPNPLSVDEFGTYKLATAAGHNVGTLTNDADSAVVGKVGPAPPSVRLQASARERGTSAASVVAAQLADERAFGRGAGAGTATPLALAQAVDDLLHSSAPVTMSVCVRFQVKETTRRLGFCNDYFSLDDAGLDLAQAAGLVENYDFSPITLQGIFARARLTRGVKQDLLVRGKAPRRVRPGQSVRVRLVVHRKREVGNRRLSFPVRIPRSLRPGRHAMVLRGTGLGPAADLAEELGVSLLDLLGEGAAAGPPEPRSLGGLAEKLRAFHHGKGITARFRRRGPRRLVYRNGSVAFTGSVRLPLRVVRR